MQQDDGGPSPASTTWKRAPLAATSRCVHGPGARMTAAGSGSGTSLGARDSVAGAPAVVDRQRV